MKTSFRSAFLNQRWLLSLGLLLAGTPGYAQGSWQSVASVGGSATDVKATTTDEAGNVYLVGTFAGSMTLGSQTLTSAGGTDIFVAKRNSGGFLWAQRAGGAGNDTAKAVTVHNGGVYVGGMFSGATAVFGSTTLTNAGPASTTDVFVARYADAGSTASLSWAQQAGGSANDELSAVAATASGVFATGAYTGSARFGNALLTSTVSTTPDIFITKLTPAAPAALSGPKARAARARMPLRPWA
ncbi:hypothetical protein [Hymenobacter cellulosilyticus]|uniref:Uncharacterized protein n=1 Tax=Hymenobacter cellulosilyticus TaxID=2932248 RepID=A0A8T9Q2P9_9BACT|nr:hypothetical protein [Hymenobacter cellulosilyticus]UOQ71242.1 hypothetical protein MUN79_21715 [Hymenobacter cellulosilyticus]